MSKLNAMGQSMAALFTPESERSRKAQASGASPTAASTGSMRVPGTHSLSEGSKSGDSLGNPASPGYDGPPGRKKPAADGEANAGGGDAANGHPETFATPSFGPETIRLSVGFEKLLLTQKKLCEKAMGIFTQLDAPGRYRNQRKGKLLNGKNRGCIVDVSTTEAPAAAPKKSDAA